MTYFTGLARVAKTTGYPVVERPGWKTRGHGQMAAIKSIICHHTASADNGNAPALGYIESNRGALPGPLAHYVLGRDGTIYVVAAGLCWHAGKVGNPDHGNTRAIGIEAENDGRGEKWGPAQYDSYVKLCAALIAEFKLPVSAVLGHKEIAVPKGRKIDPTFDMGAFRTYVAKGRYLDDKQGNTTKPAASKPATPIPTPIIKKDWFDMATENDIRNIVRDEVRSALADVPAQSFAAFRANDKDPKQINIAEGARTTQRVEKISRETRALVQSIAQRDGLTADEISTIVRDAVAESVVTVDVNVAGKGA